MPKSFRSSNKKSPPQKREPMKQQVSPEPKPGKKGLAAYCQERIHSIHDARREKEDAAKKASHKQEEDEVMACCYGPDWRTKYLSWDTSANAGHAPEVKSEQDDENDFEEEDDIPRSNDSRIRLKAS